MLSCTKNATLLDRRTTIKLSLGFLTSTSLLACSAANVTPGRLTITEIRAPKEAADYNLKYTAPKNKFEVQTLNFKGVKRQYHAYKSNRHSLAPKTALLLLHGSNRNGASLIDKWKYLADQHNILLVAPNSANESRWSQEHDSPVFMQTALDHAKIVYDVSDVKVYGFGHSAGAIMMTILSVWHSEIFSAIAVHAGNLSVENASQSKQVKKQKVPLAHFIGSNDHIFDLDRAKGSAETLSIYGQNVDLFVIKGHNHWYYDIAQYVNAKAWAFLSAH